MANKQLFSSATKEKAEIINNAGGKAYEISAAHQLAQAACTGTLGSTYYVSAENQLKDISQLLPKVDPEFIAKVAIYSRKYGLMKDLPSYLLAYLCANNRKLFAKTFFEVCDNMKMVRNFAQIIRSGAVGRKSFGTLPKRVITQWFDKKSDDTLFRSSIGNNPSIVDLIKMVHPKPLNDNRNALYGYLLDKEHNAELLPETVKHFEAFKKGENLELPKVSFEMLTVLPLTKENWKSIAQNATWTQSVKNINTFNRHSCFEDKALIKIIADRIANEEQIKKAKAFPYQLMAAYTNINDDIPVEIKNALQSAMETSVQNIPVIDGKVFVFPDVSGSMRSSVTGNRGTATSKVRCVDVAALVAASFLRMNPETEVIPFAEGVRLNVKLNAHDSVFTNAEKIFKQPGGGTNCSAPLSFINDHKREAAFLCYISDCESWLDSNPGNDYYERGKIVTETTRQWNIFSERNPISKMVCLDIIPNKTTQLKNDKRVLQIGGFSDSIYNVIHKFVMNKENTDDFWVDVIEKTFAINKEVETEEE